MENLHWLEPSSEEVLGALVERLPGTSLFRNKREWMISNGLGRIISLYPMRSLGLQHSNVDTGALGLLGKAKIQGIIPAVGPYIERAVRRGIRYHSDLVQKILDELGEEGR